jgi:hypothetical protein
MRTKPEPKSDHNQIDKYPNREPQTARPLPQAETKGHGNEPCPFDLYGLRNGFIANWLFAVSLEPRDSGWSPVRSHRSASASIDKAVHLAGIVGNGSGRICKINVGLRAQDVEQGRARHNSRISHDRSFLPLPACPLALWRSAARSLLRAVER